MAKNIVITGATDGMGAAIARHYVSKGDDVIGIGRSPEKGEALLRWAEGQRGGGRFQFIACDIAQIREMNRAVDEIAASVAIVDALIFCARHFRSERVETEDGLEDYFASFTLSRYLLSERLLPLLERAPKPLILNVAGPGDETGFINWGDLQFTKNYDGLTVMEQGGRAADLQAVGFVDEHPGARTRYVLLHPGLVSTSFSGQYDESLASQIVSMKRVGMPIEEGIEPIVALVDSPPPDELSAYQRFKKLPLDHSNYDLSDARRLRAMMVDILDRRKISAMT